MEKDIEKKALAALEREKKRFKYQNDWTAANYERQTITMPKGTKENIKKTGAASVNGYINSLISEDLKKRGII